MDPPRARCAGGAVTNSLSKSRRRPHSQTIVARGETTVGAETDWTCRFLAAGLKPAQEYWYRFTDEQGNGSRVGRTLTAPADNDARPVRFAFVSCQDVDARRLQRLSPHDLRGRTRARAAERLLFVLHLGDFIYEMVWYPEDSPGGVNRGRRLRDIVRYPNGEKMSDFHVPTTLADYRTAYKGYLTDPDLQDARARFPFVPIWDNHEFSWQGFQSQQVFNGEVRPAQTMKVAANQAWFEYQPARVREAAATQVLDRFTPPTVSERAAHAVRRARSRARAEQSRRHQLAARPSRAALRAERGAHHHRQPLLHVAADERGGLRHGEGLPLYVSGRGQRHA